MSIKENSPKKYRLFDRGVWAKYELKDYLKRKIPKKNPQQTESIYCGQKALDISEVNRIIGEHIKKNEPFWAGRMGFTEMSYLRQVIKHRMIPMLDHREYALQQLCNLSGFFPLDLELGEKYADLLLQDSKEIDMQGYWHLSMEEYIHDIYQKDVMVTFLSWLEPWKACNNKEIRPWSYELKGKKVLVIHPFEQSIRMQYENNREKIFANITGHPDLLPEFELKTIKAVQTLGETKDDRFKDWFEALEWMKSECHKTDFDVAIVGCGAYGFHLAAEIKRMNKTVIHLGGATQLLFGIKGKRWDERQDETAKMMNEYWVRPLETEKPSNSIKIEDGCYW